MARKSDYRPEYAEQASNYCLLGATDADLAQFFGVTRRTITNWKNDHPDFADALQSKEHADSQVIGALFRNALNGNVTAQIFWLKNRQGWRDKQEVEHSGKDGSPLQVQIVRFGASDADRSAT